MVEFLDLRCSLALAAVRSLHGPRRLATDRETKHVEQELVDRFVPSWVAAASCDSTASADRYSLFEFIRFLGRRVKRR
jgi:hypothetical protein